MPPLPFSKLIAIYQSIQLTSPELFSSFINGKSMWILCLQSHAHYGNGRWVCTKVGPSQYCLHSGPSFFPQGAGLHTALGLAAPWPPPTTLQWDSCEPNHLQTLTNISWRQTLQANTLDRDSSLKNIVHTSWSGRCQNLPLTAEGAECPNTH